jgi:hypothetical protein
MTGRTLLPALDDKLLAEPHRAPAALLVGSWRCEQEFTASLVQHGALDLVFHLVQTPVRACTVAFDDGVTAWPTRSPAVLA